MGRIARHRPYDDLAYLAGRRCGLTGASLQAIAADADARAVRDDLWADYERRLRDTQTYTLDAIRVWLAETGSTASRSAIDRNRHCLIARERAVALAAERARAVVQIASEAGIGELLDGGTVLAGQRIFVALSRMPADTLEDMSPSQVIGLIDALSRLRRDHSTASLADVRRQVEIDRGRRFSEEAARAQQQSGDGRLSAEQVEQIRRAVFGEAAA